MKVLLVYPWFPDTYWSFRHALSFQAKRSAFPPLGLITVSAMLPVSWEKRLVDLNVRTLTAADIKWADAIFVSAMHVQRDSLKRVIKLAKEQGKRVVVGGPYASICANELDEADHVFIGEAETTLPTFRRDVEESWKRRFGFADENVISLVQFVCADRGVGSTDHDSLPLLLGELNYSLERISLNVHGTDKDCVSPFNVGGRQRADV